MFKKKRFEEVINKIQKEQKLETRKGCRIIILTSALEDGLGFKGLPLFPGPLSVLIYE